MRSLPTVAPTRSSRHGAAVTCALLTCLALPALAEDAEPALQIPHERYVLDNGLEVVLARDTYAPIVHVQVWYHVGSKDEVAGRTGFAHLFEHLMFQGSASAPNDFIPYVQAVGGDLNGTTNFDRTNYFETVPAWHLPLALFLESDRMGALLPALDQGKLDNQRDVVKNERRQRYETPPYGEWRPWLYELMMPPGHPYAHPTIGSHADLEAATLDDVKAFFRTWYVPNNATLVVAGDFEPAEAKRLIEEQFGWIPAGNPPAQATAEPVRLAARAARTVYDDVPKRKLWLGFPTPPLFADGDAALDLVSAVLCDEGDGRLYRALVEERRIASELYCYQGSAQLQSVFVFGATATDGHTTDELEAAILDEIARLIGPTPATAEEVVPAIRAIEASFYRRNETIAGKAGTLSSYLHFTGSADKLQWDLDRYSALTPEAVTAAAATWLTQPHAALAILPEADAPADAAAPEVK